MRSDRIRVLLTIECRRVEQQGHPVILRWFVGQQYWWVIGYGVLRISYLTMQSGPVALLGQASASAFPFLIGFNMSANGLSVALREFGISDDSGLKLREAGLDDLDLIAAAFDDVQYFTSWLEVQPSVPLKCFFERCQASAKASVMSCVAQVSLPTPEVSVPVVGRTWFREL